ncbi:MAG: type II toxin-antitoxin system RatA family toxin [Planctomycetota bacterium]
MPKVSRETVIQGATPRELYDVVTDYESYPRFFSDFTRCQVHRKDGPVWSVEFFAKVIKEVSYTLEITHDEQALTTRWTFVRGKLVSDSKGGWRFSEAPGGARVDYEAEIEVNAPLLPRMIKDKIQDAILNKSIASMFTQLEAEARRRRRTG